MDIRKFDKVGKIYMSDTSFLKYSLKGEWLYFWCQHYPRQNCSRKHCSLVMWRGAQSNYCNHCKFAKECYELAEKIAKKFKEEKFGRV